MTLSRFHIGTLLAVISCSALLIALWRQLPVESISFQGSRAVLHLSDEHSRHLLQVDPYSYELAKHPDAYFHDFYVEVPVSYLAGGTVVVLAALGGTFWSLRMLFRRFGRRST